MMYIYCLKEWFHFLSVFDYFKLNESYWKKIKLHGSILNIKTLIISLRNQLGTRGISVQTGIRYIKCHLTYILMWHAFFLLSYLSLTFCSQLARYTFVNMFILWWEMWNTLQHLRSRSCLMTQFCDYSTERFLVNIRNMCILIVMQVLDKMFKWESGSVKTETFYVCWARIMVL